MRYYARRKPTALTGFVELVKANKKQFIILGVLVAAVIAAVATIMYFANRKSFDASFLVTDDTIKIGLRTDVAGFGQMDEAGNITGFDREYIDEVLSRVLPDQEKWYEYVPITSQDAGASVKYGETDLCLGLLASGTAKVNGFVLSDAYYTDRVVAVVQGNSRLDELTNMAGGKIGVLTTAIPESGVTDYIDQNHLEFEVLRYSDYESAMTDIEHNRVNAVVMPYAVAKQFEASGYRILAKPLYETGYHILLPTGQSAVASEINHVIAEMKRDGTTDALRVKWGV